MAMWKLIYHLFFTLQCAPVNLAHHMQTAFIQTVDILVFVLIVFQKEAKFVVQMEEPTNICANFKSTLAKKTSTFQLFHRVDVHQVSYI